MIAVNDPNEHYDLSKVSLLNFHYEEWLSKGVETYYSLNKPVAFDETLDVIAGGENVSIEVPRYEVDIALKLIRID